MLFEKETKANSCAGLLDMSSLLRFIVMGCRAVGAYGRFGAPGIPGRSFHICCRANSTKQSNHVDHVGISASAAYVSGRNGKALQPRARQNVSQIGMTGRMDRRRGSCVANWLCDSLFFRHEWETGFYRASNWDNVSIPLSALDGWKRLATMPAFPCRELVWGEPMKRVEDGHLCHYTSSHLS